MTIVDQLITEYLGVDRATPVIERIHRSHERLGDTVRRVTGLLLGLAAADKAHDFAGNAMRAASEYASLEARLKALTGSADLARQKLNLAQAVAAPSPFTTRQLADAAVTLEAFGVNSERVLPIIGRLGAAMGAGNEQIEMFTRAFGELSTGKMIEADVLASMGLSKRAFEKEGIVFDGQGQLKSSAVATMEALERIILGRFGNILDEMASTPEAKRASLEDAGERVMRTIGMGMLQAGAPWIESMTRVLSAITDSGVLGEVVEKITRALTGAFGGDKTDQVARFVAKVLAFLWMIPDAAREIAGYFSEAWHVSLTNVSRFFDNTEARILNFADTISARFSGFLGFGSDTASSSPVMKNGFVPDSWVRGIMQFFQGSTTPPWAARFQNAPQPRPMQPYLPFPSFPDLATPFGGKTKDFEARILAALRQPQGGLPDTSGIPFLRETDGAASDALDAIEKNTRETADNLKPIDVRQILFGGGDRARAGISLADLSPRMGPAPRGPAKIDVKVGKAATDLERALTTLLRQNLPQILRAMGVPIEGM